MGGETLAKVRDGIHYRILAVSLSTSRCGWSASLSTSVTSYLSVMATCSSIAEPVLAFQFPEMEVLLYQNKGHSEGGRDACHQSASLFCFGCLVALTQISTLHCSKSLQSCWTLCYSMDCSLPGSSVHGILEARILEWVAMPFSRGSS